MVSVSDVKLRVLWVKKAKWAWPCKKRNKCKSMWKSLTTKHCLLRTNSWQLFYSLNHSISHEGTQQLSYIMIPIELKSMPYYRGQNCNRTTSKNNDKYWVYHMENQILMHKKADRFRVWEGNIKGEKNKIGYMF